MCAYLAMSRVTLVEVQRATIVLLVLTGFITCLIPKNVGRVLHTINITLGPIANVRSPLSISLPFLL